MKKKMKKKLSLNKLKIAKINNLTKIKGGSRVTCNSELDACSDEFCKSDNC